MCLKKILIFVVAFLSLTAAVVLANEKHKIKGIYIAQPTVENIARLRYLIARSQEVGINTFVIDFTHMTRAYQQNIVLVKKSGIRYVARIVVFPDGGNDEQVLSPAYWAMKYKLAEQAISLGAQEIQLDYIRYSSARPPSSQNAKNIYKVIVWFKQKLAAQNIPLQVDVFGETTFGDSIYIGQSLLLFADAVDAICPMVYPSHYEPYQKYAKMPYFIVRKSLQALSAMFNNNPPFKIYPFIETYNYRYYLSAAEKLKYIAAQLLAVEDSDVDGWYFWNPRNQYDNVFLVLQNKKLAGKQPLVFYWRQFLIFIQQQKNKVVL